MYIFNNLFRCLEKVVQLAYVWIRNMDSEVGHLANQLVSTVALYTCIYDDLHEIPPLKLPITYLHFLFTTHIIIKTNL